MLYSYKKIVRNYTPLLLFLFVFTSCQTVNISKEMFVPVESLMESHDIVVAVDTDIYSDLIFSIAENKGMSQDLTPVVKRTNFFYTGITFSADQENNKMVFLGDGNYPQGLIKNALKNDGSWTQESSNTFVNVNDGSALSIPEKNIFLFSSDLTQQSLLSELRNKNIQKGKPGFLGLYFKDFSRLTGLPGLDKLVNFTLESGYIEIEYQEKYHMSGSFSFRDEKLILPFKSVFKLFLFSLSRSSRDKSLSTTMKTMQWENKENILSFSGLYIDKLDSSLYGLFLPEEKK